MNKLWHSRNSAVQIGGATFLYQNAMTMTEVIFGTIVILISSREA